MNHSAILVLVVIAVVLALLVFFYLHKRHVEYAWSDIERAVRGAYPVGVTSVLKSDLSSSLKRHFHCSTKEAHYLIGVARRKGLIDIKADRIDLVG